MISRINLTAFFLFLLSTLLFSFFLTQTGAYPPVIYLFQAVSQYITCVLGLLLLFQFLGRLKVQADPEHLFMKTQNLLKTARSRIPLRIKTLHNRKGNGTSEQNEAVMGNDPEVLPGETNPSGLHEIAVKKADKTGTLKNRNHSKKNILLNIAYVLLQIGNAYFFLNSVFNNLPYFGGTGLTTAGYFPISALILLSMAAFIIRKFSLPEKMEQAGFSAASFCAAFGILSAATAFLLFVQTMFALNFIPWMILFYQGVSIYLVISVALSVLFAIFEKEQTAWQSCQVYIPFLKGNAAQSRDFIELLERNTSISIKSLWSIRYFASVFPAFILSALLLLLAATCVYKIEPYQEGAVYRLGSLREASVVPPGLHLKLPWPIEKLEIYDVRREQSLQIGYKAPGGGNFLWTVSHEGGEYTLLLGNGNELVAINAKLNYCIDDLYAYLTENNDPESLLSEAAYQMLTQRTVSTMLDSFLREDRTRLSEELKKELERYSKEHKLGLEVKNFVIQSIHPAVEVADAYQGVVGADIKKNTLVTAAETEAYRLTAEAEKEREIAVISATRTQTERVSAALYEMAVYSAAYDAYRVNPKSFELDKYLSVCEKIISGHKVYVFSPKAGMDLSNYIINNTNSSSQAIIIN